MKDVITVVFIADYDSKQIWPSLTQFLNTFGRDFISVYNFGETEESLIDTLATHYTKMTELGVPRPTKLPYLVVNLLNTSLERSNKLCENLIEKLESKFPPHFVKRLVILTTNPILVNQSQDLYLMDPHLIQSLASKYYGVDLSIVYQELSKVKTLPKKVIDLIDQFYKSIQYQNISEVESYLNDLEYLNPNIPELSRMRKCLEKLKKTSELDVTQVDKTIKSPNERQDVISMCHAEFVNLIENDLDQGGFITSVRTVGNGIVKKMYYVRFQVGNNVTIDPEVIEKVTQLYVKAGWHSLEYYACEPGVLSTAKIINITLTKVIKI